MNKPVMKKGALKRLLKMLYESYPKLLVITLGFILFNAIISSLPAIFMKNIIAIVNDNYKIGNWEGVSNEILKLVLILGILYVLSLIANILYNQFLAIITQGFLMKTRKKMFDHMQSLPIKYFDTHTHGDVMSFYTNDIDTLRQLVSQSIPQLISSGAIIISVFAIMIWYSVWLTIVVLCGVAAILFVTKTVGGKSAKYFMAQQKSIGETEGFIEEMMNGQKVIKVFTYEDECIENFDKVNDRLYEHSKSANTYANMLMPILNNIGNVLYVFVAFVGGVLLIQNVKNISLSGTLLGIDVIITFLGMTKQFHHFQF